MPTLLGGNDTLKGLQPKDPHEGMTPIYGGKDGDRITGWEKTKPLPWKPGYIDPSKVEYAEGGTLKKLNQVYQLGEGRSFLDQRQGDFILRTYKQEGQPDSYATIGYYYAGDYVPVDKSGNTIKSQLPNDDGGRHFTSGRNEKPDRPAQYRTGGVKLDKSKYYVSGDELARQAGLNVPPPAKKLNRLSTTGEGASFMPTILGAPIGFTARKKTASILG